MPKTRAFPDTATFPKHAVFPKISTRLAMSAGPAHDHSATRRFEAPTTLKSPPTNAEPDTVTSLPTWHESSTFTFPATVTTLLKVEMPRTARFCSTVRFPPIAWSHRTETSAQNTAKFETTISLVRKGPHTFALPETSRFPAVLKLPSTNTLLPT